MIGNIIVWLIVGAVAGWLAGIVMKSRQGLITNIILGIIGSFVGGFVLTLVPGVQSVETGLSLGHILTAMIGAIIIIAVVRLLRRA
ncbi:MAG: GlsB/YeaQ/YmgE family stress response membrane protein [Anaerolineae bacterium]|nr:GlsB/YeaQ/YmgE family stress response membrane protein [Anaerolineae bacterium]NUQ07024.1 GlsB/YeaQ/YmgE family stress response membrane protein [Anaerolineae bacterium]